MKNGDKALILPTSTIGYIGQEGEVVYAEMGSIGRQAALVRFPNGDQDTFFIQEMRIIDPSSQHSVEQR